MKTNFCVILVAFLLVGCQMREATIGTGPVVLSSSADKYFRTVYLRNSGPGFFFVSKDGKTFSRTYCPSGPGACDVDTVVLNVLDLCSGRASQPCHIFAVGEKIVWEGTVSHSGSYADPARNTSVLGEADMSDVSICRFAVKDGTPAWSDKPEYRPFVVEAKKRNLSPEACLVLKS